MQKNKATTDETPKKIESINDRMVARTDIMKLSKAATQAIADKVNHRRKIKTITKEQVLEIAMDQNQTESHPVISEIMAEVRELKKSSTSLKTK